jgi:hypothetical protein
LPRKDGQAALLIRAQLTPERGRRRHWLDPSVRLSGKQIPEPVVGVHANEWQLPGAVGKASGQRVSCCHDARAAAFQERQRCLEMALIELHPLAAKPDQWHLEPGQLGELSRIQRLISYCQLVPEVDEISEAERRRGNISGPCRGPGPSGELEAESRPADPIGQLDAKAGTR